MGRRTSRTSTASATSASHRGRVRQRQDQYNHLNKALEKFVSPCGYLSGQRSKLKRDFLPPMVVTLTLATLITAVTLNIDSWMTPFGLASREWFRNLWKGDQVLQGIWSTVFLVTCIVCICLIYISDMRHWRTCWKYMYFPVCALIGLSVLLWASLSDQPITCLGLSIACCVAATFSTRKRLFATTHKKFTSYAECLAFSIVAIGLAGIWALWFFLWGGQDFMDGDDDWEDGDVVRTFAPVIKAGAYGFIAYFALLRSRWYGTNLATNQKNQEGQDTINLGAEFKISMLVLGAMITLIWGAVFLGIGDPAISQFFLSIAVMALACISIYIVRWIGLKKLRALAKENQLLHTMISIFSSDWFKAVILIFLGWILPFAIFVEVVHQLVRLRLAAWGILDLEEDEIGQSSQDLGTIQEEGDASEAVEEDQGTGSASTLPRARSRWWSPEMEAWLELMAHWNITSILNKSIYLGMIVFGFQVLFTKGLSIFLVYLNAYLVTWSIPGTMILLCFVLLALFQIPAMAGLILYLTASLVLIPKYMALSEPADPTARLILGGSVSVLFCLVVKLLACAFQMKVWGGAFKTNVGVKKFIGVHTQFMKTVKYILVERGNVIPKVSVLVGCPDWPTSVTTGILDLPLVPMMMGTLPVALIILPSCASSAFLLCPEEVVEQGTLSPGLCTAIQGACLAAVGISQYGFQFLALYYCQVLLDHLKEEGDLPDDWMRDPQEAEILVLVAQDAKKDKFYQEATKFQKMPRHVQTALVTGAILSVCIFAIEFLTTAFGPVTISLTPTENFGEHGMWISIVKAWGWVQFACFVANIVCLRIFGSWAAKTVPDFTEEDLAQEEGDATKELAQSGKAGQAQGAVEMSAADAEGKRPFLAGPTTVEPTA